ncbi:MAG TPA: hypothetical protein VGC72_04980 [Candidatus Elarobacter sp.]|jgi:hypothetical protein
MRFSFSITVPIFLFCTCLMPASAQTDQSATIRSAVKEYVHQQHGNQFDPHIICIRQNGEFASVNYTAGPHGDEIASTMILARNKGMSAKPWKSAVVTTSDFGHSSKFAATGKTYTEIQTQLQKQQPIYGSCFK